MANVTIISKTSARIRVFAGTSDDGKKQFFTKTVKFDPYMKKKELDSFLDKEAKKFETSCLGRTILANLTFEEVAEQWFEEYAKPTLRETSYRRMEFLKEHTYEKIGGYKLDKLNNITIQHFIDSLAVLDGCGRNGSGYSTKTCKHYLTFVSDVFEYAVSKGLAQDNPCRNVHVKNRHDEKEKQVYTRDEVLELLSVLEEAPIKYQAFFYIAAYTGLRRSEILGLKFSDIDEYGVMRVRRSANYVAEKGMFIDDTKTKSSKRNITLPAAVLNKISALRSLQITERMALGITPQEDDFLFCTSYYDEIMNANTAYSYLKRLCEKHGLRFAGIHSFRHFTASLLISQGATVAETASYLGHSSPATTMNTYIHEFKDAQETAGKRIENALSKR